MRKYSIIEALNKSSINQELKEAYSFMLLSRGYSSDEIKILDDYLFSAKKKQSEENADKMQDDNGNQRTRKQRRLPKNPVCLTSTSVTYNNRDHTLYSLNGSEPITKGRLVWSVIKLYQKVLAPTFEEVSRLFNQELNLLSYTIISEISLNALRADRQKRFYYHESDFIESKDGIRYAVSNQWAISKMDEVVSFVQSMGWEIEVIPIPKR